MLCNFSSYLSVYSCIYSSVLIELTDIDTTYMDCSFCNMLGIFNDKTSILSNSDNTLIAYLTTHLTVEWSLI